MNRTLLKLAASGFLFLVFQTTLNAQESEKNSAEKTLSVAKKGTVIVVGTSAKLGYKAAKFTALKVAKPLIIESAPVAGKFLLRQSGKTVKYSFPIVKTAVIKYIKIKFL